MRTSHAACLIALSQRHSLSLRLAGPELVLKQANVRIARKGSKEALGSTFRDPEAKAWKRGAMASAQSVPVASGGVVEEPLGMEKEAQLLTELAEIPGISAAWVGEQTAPGQSITVQYTQRDLPGNRLRKYLRTFQLPRELPQQSLTIKPSFPVELRDVLLHSVSPSGSKQLIARAGKDADSTVLEVWSGSRVIRETHVPKNIHGKVVNDNWFGTGAAWTADENRVAYVAEAPQTVRTPDWGQIHQATSDDSNGTASSAGNPLSAGPKRWRGVGEFQEDWGELNTGKKAPHIFVLDASVGTVTEVRGLPEDCSVGQPVWTPNGEGLIFVAWPHKSLNFPRLTQRLGIVYCVNRPCFLYEVEVPVASSTQSQEIAARRLETSLQSAFCPQFSPDGLGLFFLSHNAAVTSGVHCASVTLERLDWPANGPEARLIDVVEQPEGDADFPGLFSFLLSRLPFAFIDNGRLLITSHWRSTLRILDITPTSKGKLAHVEPATPIDPPAPCWTLLAAAHGLAVAALSGPGQVASLAIAHTGQKPLQWHHISTEEPAYSPAVASYLDPAREAYKILQVQPGTPPMDVGFEAVLLLNAQGSNNAPTVLTPHGGPHTAFPAAYFLSNAFLNILGYNVLQVNFRGSLGFGEASVQSLPGYVGLNDVADCVAALDAAIDQGHVDAERVAVIGGSHGGLLTGHLLGQFPDRFKAGVLRNPVLDVALMSQISDIPDWCFIEGFGSKEGLQRASVKPSLEELKRLTEMSPIYHLSEVKAPMFFMLGAKDRRVVMKDAQQYVAAMKARPDAPETRVIVFPEDTHGLDQPQTEFEQWVNAAWWLKRFLHEG